MRRLLLLPIVLLLTGAAPPQRIVSLNLCADQLLVALAEPGRIAALTTLSRDSQMSAVADRAARLPVIRGSAEEVLALRPDLLLVAPGWRGETLARLRARGIRTVELPPADSPDQIAAQIRTVARAIGRPARGEALIAGMAARLARVPANAGRGRTAVHYQRRGYVTGGGTLVDALMRRVGLVNLATRLGRPVLSRMALEEIALARPDYLLVETSDAEVEDRGTEMLAHPLIAGLPRLSVPQSWIVCGGPAYVLAAERLAAQLRNGAR